MHMKDACDMRYRT